MKTLLILIFLSVTLFSQNTKRVTLQLNWLHQFQFAGYYIAKEKGFYKEKNIDVTINEFDFNIDVSKVLENNTADFAVGRSSIIIDKANGSDVVALFATFQNSPLMLLVRNDTNIKNVNDLLHKDIMITTDAKDSASIIAMLNSQQINLDKINIIKHSFNLNDLIEKKVDAMASYVSNEPIRLEDKNIGYTIFHPKDFGFNFYSDILFSSSTFIQKNPKLTKKFYDATEKGWQYAFENIGKTAKIIHEKYNTQNKTLIQLVSEGEALKKLAFHDDSTNIGCLDKMKLQKITDIYKVLGLVKQDINLDEFVYKHNKHNSFNLHLTHNEMRIYTLSMVIFLLLFLGSIFYFIIRKRWLVTKNQLKEEIALKTQKLKEETYVDFLTQAKNKKAYTEKILEHISVYERYNTSFSIMLFDIDNFKYINDTYGHPYGDQILINLVKIVKKTIRRSDFLYRVGGEEFVVIFANTPLNDAKIVSEYVRENVEKNLFKVDDTSKEKITISIGLCEVSLKDDEKSIYTRVDTLMYKSKNSGKNTISF